MVAAHAVLFTAAGCVVRLHDHKGRLYIVVREPPDAFLVHAFQSAWRIIGGESEDNVEVVPTRHFSTVARLARYTLGPSEKTWPPSKPSAPQTQWD